MQMKRCTKCDEVKPETEFYKKPGSRDKLRSQCKACCNADSRANYYADPKKRVAQTTRWAKANPEKMKTYIRRYVEQNPEKRRETYRRYNQIHREERLAYGRTENARAAIKRCYERKKEKYRETHRNWDRANPEKLAAKNQRRRALKLGNGGSFAAQEWIALKHKYGYRCLGCGRAEPEIVLTPDHVIPLVLGGRNDITNIQPLCRSCNSRKHTKIIDYR